MASCNLFIVFFYELVATFFYVAFGCAGLVGKDPAADSNLFAMHFGLLSLVIVHVFGYLSGALLNPSVVIASFISGIIKWDRALSYIVAEFVGAFAAYYALIALLGEGDVTGASLCLIVSDKLNEGQIVAFEFMLTSILIFGLIAMMDTRNKADVLPLRFGALIAACIMVGVLNDGLGLNSALMVAAAQANDNFEKVPLYIAGQYLAAIIAPFIWKFLFAAPPPPPPCCCN